MMFPLCAESWQLPANICKFLDSSTSTSGNADHALDLQFGGKKDGANIVSTDSRANRSVGVGQAAKYEDGTPIKEFKST